MAALLVARQIAHDCAGMKGTGMLAPRVPTRLVFGGKPQVYLPLTVLRYVPFENAIKALKRRH